MIRTSTKREQLPADAPGFSAAVARAAEEDGSLSVLQLDLDELHALNQQAGREVGDAAIDVTIKTLTQRASAEGWTVGRLGGDEFALMLPGASLENAFLRAEQLRVELDAAIGDAIPAAVRCTVSIGVANLPRDAKGVDELLRKAGLALYAAKEQGGDTVGLTPGENMVLRSSYYGAAQLARLRSVAERLGKKEAVLLREALDDVLRKYDRS